MKKSLILLLSLLLVFSASACKTVKTDETMEFGSQFAKAYATLDAESLSDFLRDNDFAGIEKVFALDRALAEFGGAELTVGFIQYLTDPIGQTFFRIEMSVDLDYGGRAHTSRHIYEAGYARDEEGFFITGLRLNDYTVGALSAMDGAMDFLGALAAGNYLTVLGLSDSSAYSQEDWRDRMEVLFDHCLHDPIAYRVIGFSAIGSTIFIEFTTAAGNQTMALRCRKDAQYGSYFYRPLSDADLNIMAA